MTVVSADVLKTDVVPYLSGLEPQRPPDYRDAGPRSHAATRIVGNLPYNLTTPILFHLAELQAQHRMFTDATLMVQKEVADRLAARPGTRDYGVLTVMMEVHGRIRRLLNLPPGAFSPPPKVHSSVIQLTFGPPAVKISDHRRLEQVAKALFSQRRKMIANSLKSISRDPLPILKATGIDPKRRPETLTLAELAALTEFLASARRRACAIVSPSFPACFRVFPATTYGPDTSPAVRRACAAADDRLRNVVPHGRRVRMRLRSVVVCEWRDGAPG